MFGSAVLDVAIGMAFVYLLLSLIASAVQEIISTFLQARAANLQRGIRSLLSEDSIDDSGNTLAESVYKHGLVKGLYQDLKHDYQVGLGPLDRLRLRLQKFFGIAPPTPIRGIVNPLLLPAYIPSRIFALTMIDLLDKTPTPAVQSLQVAGADPRGNQASYTEPPALDTVANIKRVLTECKQKKTKQPFAAKTNAPGTEIDKAVEALLTLVKNAENEPEKRVERLQANLEDWYDDGMDRVSGWYKKYTQKVLLGIGLLLALLFNVDSVKVARTFWLNQDLRQSMVEAARQYTGQPGDHRRPDSCLTNSDTSGAGDVPGGLEAQMHCRAAAFQSVGEAVLLPVGWVGLQGPAWEHRLHGFDLVAANLKAGARWAFPWIASLHGLGTIAGWLVTAIAISLGAPFWFDTLNRFMVVRSTIKPQEKSRSERSKS